MFGRFLGLSASLFAVALSFQNCESETSTSPSMATVNTSGGSGNGYDGKLFAFVKQSNLCPDGTPIQALIQFKGETPVLIKEDCQMLVDEEQREVQVTKDPDDISYITYANQIFVDMLSRFSKVLRDSSGQSVVSGHLIEVNAPKIPMNQREMFVAKLDANDRLIWGRRMKLPVKAELISSALQADGSQVHVGHIQESEERLSLFVASLSKDGALNWSVQYSSNTLDVAEVRPADVAVDANGNIIVVGKLQGPALYKGFVLKLDSKGQPLWLRGHDASLNVSVDASDDIFTSSVGGSTSPVLKLSPEGETIWSKRVSSYIVSQKLLSNGDLVIGGSTGFYGASLLFKLNNGGQLQWARRLQTVPVAGKADMAGSIETVNERADGSLVASGVRAVSFTEYRGIAYSLTSDAQMQWTLETPNPFYGDSFVDELSGQAQLRLHGYTYPASASSEGVSFLLRFQDPIAPIPGACGSCSMSEGIPPTAVTLGVQDGPTAVVQSPWAPITLNVEPQPLRLKLDLRQ